MAIMPGSLLLLDTNILLAATNAGRENHKMSRQLFPACRTAGVHVAVCGQVLREYLVVCTRPVESNGFGMQRQEAMRNMQWFHSQSVFLEETMVTFQSLQIIMEQFEISGKRIHDANIAAVYLTHSVDILVTLNPRDFAFHPDVVTASPDELLQRL